MYYNECHCNLTKVNNVLPLCHYQLGDTSGEEARCSAARLVDVPEV